MGRSLSCAGGFIRQIAVQSWLQLCGSPRPCLSPVFVTHVLTDDGSRCQSEGETAVSQAPGEDIYIFFLTGLTGFLASRKLFIIQHSSEQCVLVS